MDKFELSINLGNDAMQTGSDIAEALRKVADKLDGAYGYHKVKADHGRIMDLNGNSVGRWEIS